jgi:hypothetical protein
MVNMLAANPSLGERAAARAATAGMAGSPETNADSARRRYRTLKKKGELPKEETATSREERMANEIRVLYNQRNSRIADAKDELARAEIRAESLGLNISSDLSAYLKSLDLVKDGLETLTRSSPDFAFSILLNQGITDPEQAIARRAQAVDQLRTMEENIELLRKIHQLRSIAGIPSE